MNKLLITLAAAGLLTGLSVPAVMAAATDFATADADGNQSLSINEAQLVWPGLKSADFDKADTDGNDSLNNVEFASLAAANPIPAATVDAITPAAPKAMDFASADEDGNQSLSLLEAQLVWPDLTLDAFDKADTDGNDSLNNVEFQSLTATNPVPVAAVSNAMIEAAPAANIAGAAPDFMKLDENHDTKLTLQEAQVAYPTLTLDQFNKADADGDGSISSTEFTSLSS